MEKVWLKDWPEGVPTSIRYPEVPLFELLRNSARRYPSRTALIFYGRRMTYKELDELSDRFASSLHGMGVEKGDRVALMLPNVPQFPISYYGVLKAGGIVTVVSPLRGGEELGYELVDSGAETLVALDQLYLGVQPIRERTRLRNVVITSVTEYLPFLPRLLAPLKGVRRMRYPETYAFQALVGEGESKPSVVEVDPREDVAVLQYTSGTTGKPKGAMLTHYNLVANAVQTYHWAKGWGYSEKPQERVLPVILCAIPFFHIYGMTVAMNEGIFVGATLILVPKPDPEALFKAIVEHRPSEFPAVPGMLTSLASHPGVGRQSLASVQHCITGAVPIPVEAVKKLEKIAGVCVVEGYGLTEAGPVTHCNPVNKGKQRLGSVGIPYPDTDAMVVDMETGSVILPPGKVGELAVRGPQVMKGYWNDAEETRRTLRGGWLFTGDLARMDEDGYFYIVDRKTDVISTSGQTLLPGEVEEVIACHPVVKEVAVIGVPDPYRCATEIKAFVVLKDEYRGKVSTEDIRGFCRERLEGYKVPDHVSFTDKLPKTPLGRVYRRALRESVQSLS